MARGGRIVGRSVKEGTDQLRIEVWRITSLSRSR